MPGWCEKCPNEENLVSYLEEFFGDCDEKHQIIYTQWDTTGRATLSKMISDVPTFITNLTASLYELLPHEIFKRAEREP